MSFNEELLGSGKVLEIFEQSEGLGTPKSFAVRKSIRGVVLNDAGEVALMFRPRPSAYFLPGGGVEEGEVPRETLDRELREELGIRPRVGRYLGTAICYLNSGERIHISHAYLCRVVSKLKNKPPLEKDEREMISIWIPIEKAISIFEEDLKFNREWQYRSRRERFFLKIAKEFLSRF